MSNALPPLPDNIDSLKELIVAQQAQILSLQEQLNLALARRYAASSEKIAANQLRLFDGKQWDRLLLTLQIGVYAPEWYLQHNHSEEEKKPDMKITRVGVDIAKSIFHVHAVDSHDKLQWQAKLNRSQWLKTLCTYLTPGTEVGMEACASAHHWGREL